MNILLSIPKKTQIELFLNIVLNIRISDLF